MAPKLIAKKQLKKGQQSQVRTIYKYLQRHTLPYQKQIIILLVEISFKENQKEKKMRNNTHVLVVPYPAQGHIIPLLELSRRLASQGLKVTFVVTNFSHGKVKDCEKSTIVKMALIEDGLCTEDREKPGRLSEWVLKEMPRKVEELVDEINGGDEEMIIGCVIGDHTLGWAMDIAERKGIKRAAFFPAAAANMAPGFSIPRLIDNGIIDNDGKKNK